LDEIGEHALGTLPIVDERRGGNANVERSVGQRRLGCRLCRASAMTQHKGTRFGSVLGLR
jgi:hypothetical protein